MEPAGPRSRRHEARRLLKATKGSHEEPLDGILRQQNLARVPAPSGPLNISWGRVVDASGLHQPMPTGYVPSLPFSRSLSSPLQAKASNLILTKFNQIPWSPNRGGRPSSTISLPTYRLSRWQSVNSSTILFILRILSLTLRLLRSDGISKTR